MSIFTPWQKVLSFRKGTDVLEVVGSAVIDFDELECKLRPLAFFSYVTVPCNCKFIGVRITIVNCCCCCVSIQFLSPITPAVSCQKWQ